MKFSRIFLASAVLLPLLVPAAENPLKKVLQHLKREKDHSLKVLSLGNSYSLSVRRDLPAMVKAEGQSLKLGVLYIGGCELKYHWQNVEKAQKNPKFRPYDYYFDRITPDKIKSTREKANFIEVLKREKWDVVILQQASHQSWNLESYEPYMENLVAFIRKNAPQARIMLQQTWSYRSDDHRLGKVWTFDQTGMFEKLRAAYDTVAQKYQIAQIPTGLAVQKCREKSPVSFVPHSREEKNSLRWPDLPKGDGADVVGRTFWSERKDGNDLCLITDTIHLNIRGQYLQSLVWYGTLFKTDPEQVKYFNGMVSITDTDFLKNCASLALKEAGVLPQ